MLLIESISFYKLLCVILSPKDIHLSRLARPFEQGKEFPMSQPVGDLTVLTRLCNSSSCPALYQDGEGRVFVQGSKLVQGTRTHLEVPDHEEVVEINPKLIDFLRSGVD